MTPTLHAFYLAAETPDVRGMPLLSWQVDDLVRRGAPVIEAGPSGMTGARGIAVDTEGRPGLFVHWTTRCPGMCTSITAGTVLDPDDPATLLAAAGWLQRHRPGTLQLVRRLSEFCSPDLMAQVVAWAVLVPQDQLVAHLCVPSWSAALDRPGFGRLFRGPGADPDIGARVPAADKHRTLTEMRRLGIGVYDTEAQVYLPPILPFPYPSLVLSTWRSHGE